MKFWFFFIMTGLLAPSTIAQASLLGDEITATWSVGGGSVYFDSDTFLTSDGVDLDGEFGNLGSWGNDLDVTETSIIVDMTYGQGFGDGPLVWQFLDIDPTPGGAIGNVIVHTNYQDWSDSFLSFDAHSITVHFGNAVYFDSTSDIFELLIVPVPAPSALLLLGSGLATLVAARRRGKRN